MSEIQALLGALAFSLFLFLLSVSRGYLQPDVGAKKIGEEVDEISGIHIDVITNKVRVLESRFASLEAIVPAFEKLNSRVSEIDGWIRSQGGF